MVEAVLVAGSEKAAAHRFGLSHSTVKHHLANARSDQFLPGNGGIGGQPTIAPSPSLALLARGNFNWRGLPVELEATGEGSSVTGRMTGTTDDGGFTVDLQCTRTTEDGLIVIAGDTTDSTTILTYEGTRAGIIFKRGSPVRAMLWFQRDDTRAACCLAFIDRWLALGLEIDHISNVIEGTVALGP